ncbi:SDR family NAD(P)-dependent oxidoreductase [Microbacterium sp. A84]|uniref:SDR family NAD(P)-dependent oxidoreductase n=1 Tax=Microbacterium sp. A84 TaxID=3450715 RepID=UPI003F43C84E
MTFPVLQDKVIIVTGSAQGMGAATARLAAAAGAKVIVADFNEAGGQAVVDSIKAEGGEATFVMTDVSDSASVENMVKKTVEAYGRLDGAVNNAALKPDTSPLSELDDSYFDRLIGVDLKGVALCLKFELRQLIEQAQGGSIVNISSTNAFRPQYNQGVYTAAKHGVVGLTKSAALENGSHNIRVNSVAPGAIETPMLFESMADNNLKAEDVAPTLSVLNRFGKPEEVAEGSVWLLSDSSSYVTGSVLHIDGGYTGR